MKSALAATVQFAARQCDWLRMNLRDTKQTSLLIIDDAFPNLLSAFRVAEFNNYLEHFPDAIVRSTFETRWPGVTTQGTKRIYHERFPQYDNRVDRFSRFERIRADLAYCIFINNAYRFLDFFEVLAIPFAFTLYPGGGFQIDDAVSDAKLKRVFASPCFSHVIATQSVTHRYLQEKIGVPAEQTTFVYGGVLPAVDLTKVRPVETRDRINVCFVANRYTPLGTDKGYDIFVEVAKRLSAQRSDVHFHVVGPWDESVLDVSGVSSRITFHGLLTTEQLAKFFEEMDVIVSPNRANDLAGGAFDGFPTGACIEAGLAGVAVFCTDPLGLNHSLVDGCDFVIIEPDSDAATSLLAAHLQDPQRLSQIRSSGQSRFREVFDLESQMEPRRRVLSGLMDRKLGSDRFVANSIAR